MKSELLNKRCKASGLVKLSDSQIALMLPDLQCWEREAGQIVRRFSFKNFHETMAFVNAIAWLSHREDHHPDLEVGYSNCTVRYSTHSVGGLSENDFICAVKVDVLMM